MRRQFAALFFLLIVSAALHAECDAKQDHRSNKSKGILVEQVTLEGTHTLDSTAMQGIKSSVSGGCFDDSPEVIASFIRDELQQKGYLLAKVEHVRIEAGDALAVPEPSSITAGVTEGPLFHVGDVHFKGNSAFTPEPLAAAFTLKPGETFSTASMRGGIGGIRKLYASAGYIDVLLIPSFALQTTLEPPQAAIYVDVTEGKQYHMGKLRVFGTKDQATALQSHWGLAEGTTFDGTYPQKFVQENRSMLPASFQERQDLHVYRDCSDATVTVAIILDWRQAAAEPLSDIGCERPKPPKMPPSPQ